MTLQRQRRRHTTQTAQWQVKSIRFKLTLDGFRGKVDRRQWTMKISDEIRVQIIRTLRRIWWPQQARCNV